MIGFYYIIKTGKTSWFVEKKYSTKCLLFGVYTVFLSVENTFYLSNIVYLGFFSIIIVDKKKPMWLVFVFITDGRIRCLFILGLCQLDYNLYQ